jgi:hypothetical protein
VLGQVELQCKLLKKALQLYCSALVWVLGVHCICSVQFVCAHQHVYVDVCACMCECMHAHACA